MDGIPVSLMEALYVGIPVVSTSISGIPELIKNGKEGFLVEPAEVEQLSNAITTLLKDEEIRKKMAEEGKKKIEKNFNLHVEVQKLVEIWDSK
jgi:glycosyltransferase involved in cell wall biosynthesis